MRACAWRATFVSASWAIRNAAASTAAGSGGSGSGSAISQPSSAPLSAAACWRSAPVSPSWSSAGGRSPYTSRRTSATVPSRLAAARSSSVSAACRVGGEQAPGGVDREDSAGERRPEPVVQVAAQPPALLLARGDEPLARALDLDRERDGAGGGARAAGEVLEQPPVGVGQRLAVRARADQQRADPLARVDEREPQRDAGVGRAVDRRRLARRVGQLDRDVRQPQLVADRLDHHGQHARRRHRLAQPPAERGDRRVRLVAPAVQQPADGALDAVAQRLERDRDERRGDQRGAELDVLAERAADAEHGRDVEPAQHAR